MNSTILFFNNHHFLPKSKVLVSGALIIHFVLLLCSATSCSRVVSSQLISESAILPDTAQTLFPVTISGIVRDSATNEPLVSATIMVFKNGQNAARGCLTDFEGRFKLSIEKALLETNYVCLLVSYPGYCRNHLDIPIDNCFDRKKLIVPLTPVPPNNQPVYIKEARSRLGEAEARLITDSLMFVTLHEYLKAVKPCEK